MKDTFLSRLYRRFKTSSPAEQTDTDFRLKLKSNPFDDLRPNEPEQENYTVQIDPASKVLSLDVEDPDDGRKTLHSTLRSAMGITYGSRCKVRFVSAAMLLQKAKQFDDGLVAAIALTLQKKTAGMPCKAAFIASLIEQLLPIEEQRTEAVLPVLIAASVLGGRRGTQSERWRAKVDSVLDDFFSDPLRSKPLGVYTWTMELTDVFRQDRMLQNAFSGENIAVLASVLTSRTDLRETYEKLLSIGERVTNYYALPDLRSRIADGSFARDHEAALFPPCASPEASLMKRLFPPPTPIPDGFSLMDELIRQVQSGELSLNPTSQSGWYEYQLWSLESLVIPDKTAEIERLQLYPKYRDHLVKIFKGAYALARETHVKDLEVLMDGMAMVPQTPIRISPYLSLEPVATCYQRRALAYGFIGQSLYSLIGEASLWQIRRWSQDGPVSKNLADELAQMEVLFWGAYATSMTELGLPVRIEPDSSQRSSLDENSCIREFQSWQASLLDDADISTDCRMMVPVFYDLGRKKTKVWVFLGWKITWLTASFAKRPTIKVLDSSGKECEREVVLASSSHAAATPVTHEVYVSELMDRQQFREHCDKYQTAAAIMENLR